MNQTVFLPGVDADRVLDRLLAGAGDEIGSGKFASPESSAALAANCFGWFMTRPASFPLPRMIADEGSVQEVTLEFCARFPWSGGRHPWLDAVVRTATQLIGVESKRYEPFRAGAQRSSFSVAYDRPVWGERMIGYCAVRDRLRDGSLGFDHLDATQLVKHAYGLRTEGLRRQLHPVLWYVYAEPSELGGRPIPAEAHRKHKMEIEQFAHVVAGDEVRFVACSYGDWMSTWPLALQPHATNVQTAFRLR